MSFFNVVDLIDVLFDFLMFILISFSLLFLQRMVTGKWPFRQKHENMRFKCLILIEKF